MEILVYRLALVRFRMASYESTMGALRESMQLERKNGKTLYLVGRVYDKMRAPAKAAEMFEAVLRIEPGHRDAGKALKKIRT